MQYRMLKLISYIICLLPYRVVLALGTAAGRLFYYAAARQRNRAIEQMRISLGISTEQARTTVAGLCDNIGRTFLEIMYMPVLTPANLSRYVEIENMQYLEGALAEGKGVVLLTAHIGNWEWLGAALALSDLPVTTVIKRQPNDQHTKILNEYREMTGIEVFARGTTELIAAAKALKRGKILGFLADQDAGPQGVFIDFLGKPASTPLGPAVFAKRFQAPVVPVFIVRKPTGGHKILIDPPIYYQDSGQEERDLHDLTAQMTTIIENVIRSYPDQWLWFQKRWNTPAPDAVARAERGACS